jgi:hypothetical protein
MFGLSALDLARIQFGFTHAPVQQKSQGKTMRRGHGAFVGRTKKVQPCAPFERGKLTLSMKIY